MLRFAFFAGVLEYLLPQILINVALFEHGLSMLIDVHSENGEELVDHSSHGTDFVLLVLDEADELLAELWVYFELL